MPQRRPRSGAVRRRLAATSAWSALALLLAGGLASSGAPSTVVEEARTRPPGSEAGPAIPPFYAEAARQAQQGDWAAAERTLAPLLASRTAEGGRARIVLGLLAWSHERCDVARERLGAGPGPAALEDWRLYALAECASSTATATSSPVEASADYETLISRFPYSPLSQRALIRLAELAWSAGDAELALVWIERGRGRGLSSEDVARLDTLAWSIGRARGDDAVETDAARRLLVGAPLEASKLEVALPLAARGLDWRTLLTTSELLVRAEALLEVDVPQGALTTLAAVPEAARNLAWSELQARALTGAERGAEALALLAGIQGSSRDERARIELLRSRAADEAATVRRGRAHPSAEVRNRLQEQSRDALARAAELAESPELRKRALSAQFAELEAEDRIDEAIAVLRRLTALDPQLTVGARALWQRGWREYRSANYSGAIGYWTELGTLYPALSYSRSAAYWSARAHEALGERERARSGYLEIVAADTRDFYARQAELRLQGSPAAASAAAAAAEAERDPWPTDPALARARLLSDLGLDVLAALEIEQLGAVTEPRAAAALKGVVLARQGEPRGSLRELRKAFPRLGTAHQQTVPRAALELYYPRPFDDRVVRFAEAQRLPSSLVFGIVHQESGFDAGAVSRSGARGLMQIMPATGRELAKRLELPYTTLRLLEPDYSLRLGTTYFRQLLGQFDDRVELALAGYNGGPGRIGRLWRAHGETDAFDLFLEDLALEESRNYVKRILVLAESYRSLYSDLS